MPHPQPEPPPRYEIQLSEEGRELLSVIQEHRRHAGQPMTDAAILEDAIRAYDDLLVERGILNDKD